MLKDYSCEVVPKYYIILLSRESAFADILLDEDYEAYPKRCPWCTHLDIEVWAYGLMPNHAHLIAVPPSEKALSQAIGEAHRRYTRRVNFREGWLGNG